MNDKKKIANDEEEVVTPLVTAPQWTIKGGTSIKHFVLLNDKRHILTKDTEDNIVLWDILKVSLRMVMFVGIWSS